MGYFLNKEFDDYTESNDLDKLVDDENKQTDFHRDNFLNQDLDKVALVLKKMLDSMAKELNPDSLDSIIPLLGGMAEAIIHLRAEVQVLQSELIENKEPPPDSFDMN
tara:strand:- start:1831 stop:2151 length:321 start_codon:yes stop_codon:yes gene_type:complete